MYGQQHSMTREYKHEIDPPANKEKTMIFFHWQTRAWHLWVFAGTKSGTQYDHEL